MKPQSKDFIPFFGFKRYFTRYFDQDFTTSKDAIAAIRMELYHIVVALIIIITLIKLT